LRKGIILAIGALAFLVGCKSQGNSADAIHLQPKWKGQPYHISFDTKSTKPSTAGITIPDIQFKANPQALENRACLIVRFEAPKTTQNQSMMNQIVMGPTDIHGAEGTLPAEYMNVADTSLAHLLDSYHIKGKVKVSVLLARSSINSQPGNDEIAENQLSDWLSTELDYKGPRRAR